MNVVTNSRNLPENLTEYVESRLAFALDRHSDRVGRVSVRLEEKNGWYSCRVLVELRRVGAPRHGEPMARSSSRLLVVTGEGDRAHPAIDLAVDRAASRAVREFERGRERTSERVVAHLAADDDDAIEVA